MTLDSYPSSNIQTDFSMKSTIQIAASEVADTRLESAATQDSAKGLRFWMIFVAICVSMFMSALEFVSHNAKSIALVLNTGTVGHLYRPPHHRARLTWRGLRLGRFGLCTGIDCSSARKWSYGRGQ